MEVGGNAGEVDDVSEEGDKGAIIHWLTRADVVNVACTDGDTFFGGDIVGHFGHCDGHLRHCEGREGRICTFVVDACVGEMFYRFLRNIGDAVAVMQNDVVCTLTRCPTLSLRTSCSASWRQERIK